MDGGGCDRASTSDWAGWTLWRNRDPFEDHCGPYYWRELDGGDRVCGLTAAPQQMVGSGSMHGGSVLIFADYSIVVIAPDVLRDRHSVTAALNGEFVATARVGDRTESHGEVVKAGRSLAFVRGLVVNASTGRAP